MSAEQLPPPSSRAAERLAVIVDAAERAALSVIDDAEQEAKRYLEEARSRADRIVAAQLREAADRLESQGEPAAGSQLRSVEPEPEPEAAEDRGLTVSVGGGSGSAAARLLATEMAVSGSSRKEIETRLRNGFEIEDTSEILDAILGPEE